MHRKTRTAVSVLAVAMEVIQDAIGTPDKASFFLIKGMSAFQADELTGKPQRAFLGYNITPMAQVSKTLQQKAVGLREFKETLTGMAVVISFLVVLQAMYTTIIERTREIGILRAIGASQAKVVRLVIAESSLICATGVGVVQLSRGWALIAAGLGLAGGLLGSLYPALRAARMDPIHALNLE